MPASLLHRGASILLPSLSMKGVGGGTSPGSLLWPTLVALAVIFASSRVAKLLAGLKKTNYLVGFRVPFSPYQFLGFLLPPSFFNLGYTFMWDGRFELYKKFKSETFAVTPWLAGTPLIFTSNLDIMRQLVYGSLRTDFAKPPELSASFLFWGPNLFATDGETWRRHRRIVGPAFNSQLYQHVWNKTTDIYEEMIDVEGWSTKASVEVDAFQRLTTQVALLAISICGFGFSFSWAEPPKAEGGRMSLQTALKIVGERNNLVALIPRWMLKLPFRHLREADEAIAVMMDFMKAHVHARKTSLHSGTTEARDAFSLMIKANEDEDVKYPLDDTELIGNVFVMLFAGHESTALTLAATVAYLAVNPDIQKDIVEQIVSVVGWEGRPGFDAYPKLNKVLAAFYEAARLFPAGHMMIRTAQKDTVVHIPRPVGEEGTDPFPVSKGTTFVVDVIGLQYNERYFDEPEKFKPSRWENPQTGENETFTAFSLGPRECIGRKFATTESVCFLTLLLRDWIAEPWLQNGESVEQWKNRVFQARLLMTLGTKDAPIRLVRRNRHV